MRSCKTCAAKDQTIKALVDQVEWLRMQLGTPRLVKPSEASAGTTQKLYQSEEESDIRWLQENGDIDPRHAEMLLEQIGALNTSVTISH